MTHQTKPNKTITKSEFDKMGKEWTNLDTDYDNLFQEFLNNPHIKSQDELLKFKDMQNRLYKIELELHEVAEGTTIIKD